MTNIEIIRQCAKEIHAIDPEKPQAALVILRDTLAEALVCIADELIYVSTLAD